MRVQERFFPITPVTIEVVRHCQQACRYCYRLPASTGTPEFLAPETLRICLERLKSQFGRMAITISGGEPTLHTQLPELVRLCREYSRAVTLISNLGCMTFELASELARSNLQHVQTTFISPIPAEHDALCGTGTFSRWLTGFEAARRAGLNLGAILLVTPATLERIPVAIDFLLGLGVKGWMVNRFNAGYRTTADASSLFLDQTQLERMLSLLEGTAARRGLTIPFGVPIPVCLADPKRYPHLVFASCPLGRKGQYWTVGADGFLRPCNHLPIKLGDLRLQSIAEMLQQATWQQILAHLHTPPPPCSGCAFSNECQGGCRAAAHTWNGSLAHCDPWVEQLLSEKRAHLENPRGT